MKAISFLLSTVLVLGLFVTGCIKNTPIGQSSTVSTDSSTDYKMPASGFVFPLNVARLDRGETKQYDSAGQDVSVGYNSAHPDIKITTYVYIIPTRQPAETLSKHFLFCKSEVVRMRSSARLLSDGPVKVKIGTDTQPGMHAQYTYAEDLFGSSQEVLSEVYLFTYNGWFVLYRITYPKSDESICKPVIKKYLEDLKWPAKSS